MNTWISDTLARVSEDPVLQGGLAALCTFILEDPTVFAGALLVADGHMAFSTAFIGLSIGIALGDWGLYAIGRLVGPKTVAWGLVTQRRLDRANSWFERNLVVAILVSRFIPGLRIPTNVGAGIIRASFVRYFPVAVVASVIWTFLTLTVISKLGEAALPYLGAFKWPIGIALLLVLIYVQFRSRKYLDDEAAESETPGNVASFFEFWPPAVFYAPVAVYYFWLALRYRSLTLPTAVNPSIYSGGMIRESKSEILALIPESMQRWVAPHVRFERPRADMALGEAVARAETAMREAGIDYPIVAKPDEGQRGTGVRPVRDAAALGDYIAAYPGGNAICLQQLVPYENEVGILYYRFPHEDRGRVTSITLKEFPKVIGDGIRTLRQLIEANPRARATKATFFRRHTATLDHVVGDTVEFPLVFAGNHKQGCVFRNGMHILTPELEARIDEMSRAIPGFYFGRFDIRFRDTESFQRGEAFQIVELNGAGAEATHIWDPDAQLGDAYRTLFDQFRVLFAIGDANRMMGHRPLGPLRFLADFVFYQRIARKYPLAH